MNATELRDEHIEKVYKAVVGGAMDHKQAKEANNALGKIIGTAKAQLEAIALSNKKPNDVRKEIPFLK